MLAAGCEACATPRSWPGWQARCRPCTSDSLSAAAAPELFKASFFLRATCHCPLATMYVHRSTNVVYALNCVVGSAQLFACRSWDGSGAGQGTQHGGQRRCRGRTRCCSSTATSRTRSSSTATATRSRSNTSSTSCWLGGHAEARDKPDETPRAAAARESCVLLYNVVAGFVWAGSPRQSVVTCQRSDAPTAFRR